MSYPITKVAVRRIKNNLFKNLFLILAIFFSMTTISFFVFFAAQTVLAQNQAYKDLPFYDFFDRVRSGMLAIALLLTVIAFITVRSHCKMRNEENKQTLAILTSVGATESQKRRLVLADFFLLYMPSTILGIVIGIFPGIKVSNLFMNISKISNKHYVVYAAITLLLCSICTLVIFLCNILHINAQTVMAVFVDIHGDIF